MTTYTIAYGDLLYAVVPDGADLYAALRAEEDAGCIEIDPDTLTVEHGLTLTNEIHDSDTVIWRNMGTLSDEHGREFNYAVRRK